MYSEATFAIGPQFIRHGRDASETIVDLQGNTWQIPYCQMWCNTGYSLQPMNTRLILEYTQDCGVYPTVSHRNGDDTLQLIATRSWSSSLKCDMDWSGNGMQGRGNGNTPGKHTSWQQLEPRHLACLPPSGHEGRCISSSAPRDVLACLSVGSRGKPSKGGRHAHVGVTVLSSIPQTLVTAGSVIREAMEDEGRSQRYGKVVNSRERESIKLVITCCDEEAKNGCLHEPLQRATARAARYTAKHRSSCPLLHLLLPRHNAECFFMSARILPALSCRSATDPSVPSRSLWVGGDSRAQTSPKQYASSFIPLSIERTLSHVQLSTAESISMLKHVVDGRNVDVELRSWSLETCPGLPASRRTNWIA
ncbi:hypothetical protein PR048_010021 [Dryococelus australis]|uniref:Uncharacterized protein n=1 Tax=Dryococelus australis TaxID=614101 RepID=A0ABQ9I1Z0_9NEOP|nr:hypothetical protein PR048_010021 [Dryococelus australis]